MSKHIAPTAFYELPSGSKVYPCRLIHKDGTLMWRHACEAAVPTDEAHEQHIIKTAQRLEELNSWVSREMELWNCLLPVAWYVPDHPELSEGISVYFKHTVHQLDNVYSYLKPHIFPHEKLELRREYIHFRRC